MARSSRPVVVGLVVGIALGSALSGVTLGLGVTHQECSRGPVVGWSGHLAALIALGVPPPGGLVNWSYTWGGDSGSMDTPANSTLADYTLLNWTAVSETPVTKPGWGPGQSCPPIALEAPTEVGTSCGGCLLAPGVVGGVGARTVLPVQGSFESDPTVLLDGLYPSSPLGSFEWNISNGAIYIDFAGARQFAGDATPYQPSTGAPYAGLELHVTVSEVQFGVPIHLLNGTIVTFPSGTPQWLPGTHLTIHLTYIFPGPGNNETWNIYAAGGRGVYPLGGYLFEQLS